MLSAAYSAQVAVTGEGERKSYGLLLPTPPQSAQYHVDSRDSRIFVELYHGSGSRAPAISSEDAAYQRGSPGGGEGP